MSQFSKAFAQLFAMLSSFFAAGEALGTTVLNLATVAEESSGAYMDQARIDRARAKAQLEHQQAEEAKLLTQQ